ncbi:hypothetical protein RF11_06965 [Thelohanellus kitauei]|uniref:Uncharacterized protein n=1 Tax=Thelohanellus kitauei TaxID=669202 RepID=A0A0C2M4I1_THEKT|nr:hypothetical protein RF11_06965 [Thelohanellus kitauei]
MQHLASCGVTSSVDRKAKLFSRIGSKTYSFMSKIHPGFDSELSYNKIRKSLSQYCELEVKYVHACVEFSRRVLMPDQSYKQWVAELRNIAIMCRFIFKNEKCECSLMDRKLQGCYPSSNSP